MPEDQARGGVLAGIVLAVLVLLAVASARARPLLLDGGETRLSLRQGAVISDRYFDAQGRAVPYRLVASGREGDSPEEGTLVQQIFRSDLGLRHGVLHWLSFGLALSLVVAREELSGLDGASERADIARTTVDLGDSLAELDVGLVHGSRFEAVLRLCARLPTGRESPGRPGDRSLLTSWGQSDLGAGLELQAEQWGLVIEASALGYLRLPARVQYLGDRGMEGIGSGSAKIDPGDLLDIALGLRTRVLPWLGLGVQARARIWGASQIGRRAARAGSVGDGEPANPWQHQGEWSWQTASDSEGYLFLLSPQILLMDPGPACPKLVLQADLLLAGMNSLILRKERIAGSNTFLAEELGREENTGWSLSPTGLSLGEGILLGEISLLVELPL